MIQDPILNSPFRQPIRHFTSTVLAARMNPDLAMGDELLKKTGAGNLFMVFGEPDIKITTEGVDGHMTVEVRGVDVQDPVSLSESF